MTIAEKANQTIEEERKSPTIQYSSIPKSLSEHAKQKNALQNMFRFVKNWNMAIRVVFVEIKKYIFAVYESWAFSDDFYGK